MSSTTVPVGKPTLRQRLSQGLTRFGFALTFLISVVGTGLVCAGLALLTDYCQDHQPFGLGAGFKLDGGYAVPARELMRILRAPVTTTSGGFDCGRYFRYDWFLFALQVVFLLIVALAWIRGTIRRYQAALWALGAVVTAWHMYRLDFIVQMDHWTEGALHTNGMITAAGLILCCLGNFLMFFAGAALADKQLERLLAGQHYAAGQHYPAGQQYMARRAGVGTEAAWC
jgi:hypothetical protein